MQPFAGLVDDKDALASLSVGECNSRLRISMRRRLTPPAHPVDGGATETGVELRWQGHVRSGSRLGWPPDAGKRTASQRDIFTTAGYAISMQANDVVPPSACHTMILWVPSRRFDPPSFNEASTTLRSADGAAIPLLSLICLIGETHTKTHDKTCHRYCHDGKDRCDFWAAWFWYQA